MVSTTRASTGEQVLVAQLTPLGHLKRHVPFATQQSSCTCPASAWCPGFVCTACSQDAGVGAAQRGPPAHALLCTAAQVLGQVCVP